MKLVTEFWKDTGTPHDILHANECNFRRYGTSYFHGTLLKMIV